MGQQKTAIRDVSFDIARALSALWVIGVWHLFCYDISLSYANMYTQRITDIFLGCFMYISGYMLSKYKIESMRGTVLFYKKRFIRFYILYFLAMISLYVAGMLTGNPMISSKSQLILALLGVASFFPPHVGTFWFMTMIMSFYFITPLLLYQKHISKKIYLVLLLVIVIYLFFILWQHITGYVEPYIYLFFPVYFIGLFTNHECLKKITKNNLLSCLFIFLTIFLVCVPKLNQSISIIVGIVMILSGIIGIIWFSEKLSRIKALSRVFTWVSYSSLCAYLFHRHVYSLVHSVFTHFNLSINLVVLWFIFLPCALIVAWGIQTIYDKSLSKLIIKYGEN